MAVRRAFADRRRAALGVDGRPPGVRHGRLGIRRARAGPPAPGPGRAAAAVRRGRRAALPSSPPRDRRGHHLRGDPGLPRGGLSVRPGVRRRRRRLLQRDRRRAPEGRLVVAGRAVGRACPGLPLAVPMAAAGRRPGRALDTGGLRHRVGRGRRGRRRTAAGTPRAVGGRPRGARGGGAAAGRRGTAAHGPRAPRRAGPQHLRHQCAGRGRTRAARLRPGTGQVRPHHDQGGQQGGARRGTSGARQPPYTRRRPHVPGPRPRPAARTGRAGGVRRAHRHRRERGRSGRRPARRRSRRLPHHPGGPDQRRPPLRLPHRAGAHRPRLRARPAPHRRRGARHRGRRGRRRQRTGRYAGAGRRPRWHDRGGAPPGRRLPGPGGTAVHRTGPRPTPPEPAGAPEETP